MHSRSIVATYRLAFSVLVLFAVCVELQHSMYQHTGIVNFFSYFTYESNIFAAIVFLLGGAVTIRGHTSETFALWRGAATVYMLITGVVYALLLRTQPVAIVWTNDVLHYIFPVVIFADWFIDTPRRRIPYKNGLIWIVYPLLYLAYTLIRGPIVHWYPYTFINPAPHGYASVTSTSIQILVATLVLVEVLTYATKRDNHGLLKDKKDSVTEE